MARYCTLAKYRGYLNNLKNIKELGLPRAKNCKELNNLCETSQKGIWNDIVTYISQTKSGNSSRIIGPAIDDLETKRNASVKNKNVRNKFLQKEVQKLCSKVQKQLLANRHALWATATVSAVTTSGDGSELVQSGSTSATETAVATPAIPEAPQILDTVEESVNQLNALGEPTFASLGLGGYSPVGIVQWCFEYLHVTLGVEWWLAIAIGTLIIRMCLFPLVVISQRNAAKMNNHLPQMQLLQMKITEARQTGNNMDVARYSQELMLFMKEKQLNPFKNMIVPLAQMPIFISFFMGLREMANVPVDSLRTGGMLWFVDLTLPDQYFLLPLITSATLFATIELGTDAARMSSPNMQIMKYVLRGIPIVMLPFIMNFPSAILCYWVSTNFISLVQVGFLKIPKVRSYFNIEPLQRFDPSALPMQPKGFKQGIKESWSNLKLTRELEERRKLDELQFQKAGKGPITKTYKFDPTKHIKSPGSSTPVSAKER